MKKGSLDFLCPYLTKKKRRPKTNSSSRTTSVVSQGPDLLYIYFRELLYETEAWDIANYA